MAERQASKRRDTTLYGLRDVANRVGFYKGTSGVDALTDSKKAFDPNILKVPRNPISHVLSDREWWVVYGIGYLEANPNRIADISAFSGGPQLEPTQFSAILKRVAHKLGMPDGKAKTVKNWARQHPYEELVSNPGSMALKPAP